MIWSPFEQQQDTYLLKLSLKNKYLPFIEEFCDFAADSVAVNYSSKHVIPHEEENCMVELYFEGEINFEVVKSHLEKIAFERGFDLDISETFKLEDIDWVKKVQEDFRPFVVENFFITSDFYKDQCPEDKLPIIVEAARAFGTGEHSTTQGCIEALSYTKKIAPSIKSILDMGTGTGILAMAAGKLWNNVEITACDIEEIAVKIALENFKLNNINNISAFVSDGYNNEILNKNGFDLIVSNILAGPLINFAKNLSFSLKKFGFAILAGFLTDQASAVIDEHRKFGLEKIYELVKNDWVILVMQKN